MLHLILIEFSEILHIHIESLSVDNCSESVEDDLIVLQILNCYDDMTVSFDSCESWERNPDPEEFADKLVSMSGNSFLRAIFEAQGVMIDIEPDDTYMTVYDPESRLLDRLRSLTTSEGLFLWSPPS